MGFFFSTSSTTFSLVQLIVMPRTPGSGLNVMRPNITSNPPNNSRSIAGSVPQSNNSLRIFIMRQLQQRRQLLRMLQQQRRQRPTTARPTTARPTTARPTTARPVRQQQRRRSTRLSTRTKRKHSRQRKARKPTRSPNA
jgi:hypothetical protein